MLVLAIVVVQLLCCLEMPRRAVGGGYLRRCPGEGARSKQAFLQYAEECVDREGTSEK